MSGNGNGHETGKNDRVGAVMVVGAGIGGMQASLDLANCGFKVYLLEETSAIGGRMVQLDKTFPTNDCSMCIISPKLVEVDKHKNIEIITNADLLSLDGEPGNFTARVLKRPRYVDLDKCNSCGDCLEVCPVALPSEFDEETMDRRAIHKRYPQAIPNTAVISKSARPPCVLACEAETNPQAYLALVAEERFEDAYRVITRGNPFPAVCGRVCHHPCEQECNRNDIDEPVAINAVKRFVSDWMRAKRKESGNGGYAVSRAEIDPEKPKVAMIGGGPAGLTCARDLVLEGYPVTLFEAADKLGGMMNHGIPEYRLPRDELHADIQDIVDLGVEVHTGKSLGLDFTLDALRKQGYKAFFVAIGSQLSRRLPPAIEGQDLDGVIGGTDFLRDAALGKDVAIGKKVVVIGGGNVAIDVAMTAKRLGAEQVELCCLECRDEMPAHSWEIEDAADEGVILSCEWGPDRIVGENGRVTGVDLIACTCVFNPQGAFAPEYDASCKNHVDADTVIVAIGQATDLSWVQEADGIQTERGVVKVDPLTLETSCEDTFSGGDCVTIPKSVMEAVGYGHRAAESIIRRLNGQDLRQGRTLDKPEPAGVPDYKEWAKSARNREPKTPVAERTGDFREITHALTQEQAIGEAKRCMACGLCCECLMCVEACQPGAILHEQEPEQIDLDVGSVILLPGFDKFNPRLRGEYGYGRIPNVITSLEFERILSASGPYQGHVKRPSDLKEPGKMAWIQCVGSRDPANGNDYCSSVCCMYAIKEAIMAVDHVPGLDATIFYNDIRTYGKGFEFYYESSKDKYDVTFRRGILSTVREVPKTGNVLVSYVDEKGEVCEEEYDMLVLSVGLRPSESTGRLAQSLDLELNRFGFCPGDEYLGSVTNREGVYVAGAFNAPMDIPETVMTASTATALASEYLAEVRHTQVTEKTYPPERDVSSEEPRIGVFVCRCGTNIARAVDVPSVAEYAKSLSNVVHAEENLYTCSTDTQVKIIDAVKEHNLNRVVVASCTPRTHEPLFQDTIREAGLNKYLFEMANIRDQCSWVHGDKPEEATFKAEDLVRMAVARARSLEALEERKFEVDQRALVIGGGISGITTALSVADQGYDVHLVEKERELGGLMRRIRYTNGGTPPAAYLAAQIERLTSHPRVTVYTGARVVEYGGHVGKFVTTIETDGGERVELGHGAIILATGGQEYAPVEYSYPDSDRVVTQLELEEILDGEPERAQALREVVMIQCVGSREPEAMYCSRVCCQEAIKNALKIKEINPEAAVYVLYRDIRTYGFHELDYQKARDLGVVFIRFDPEARPEVAADNGNLRIRVLDDILGEPVEFSPDLLVLSAAIRPRDDREEIATLFKFPFAAHGFFLEAHMKLRPLDFASEGMFLAGLAHAPKTIPECISQAKGAAARAVTVISQKEMYIPGNISVVDPERCAACLTCVRLCPYDVPRINEDNVAFIEPAMCQGCGVCSAACPRKAIETRHYKDGQLVSKTDGLFDFDDLEYERCLGRRFKEGKEAPAEE